MLGWKSAESGRATGITARCHAPEVSAAHPFRDRCHRNSDYRIQLGIPEGMYDVLKLADEMSESVVVLARPGYSLA